MGSGHKKVEEEEDGGGWMMMRRRRTAKHKDQLFIGSSFSRSCMVKENLAMRWH